MFSGVEQPKRGRGRPPKPKAPAAESIPLVKPRLLLSDDEDDDYQPNWAATGVGFSQVVRHIGAEAHLHKEEPTNEKSGDNCHQPLGKIPDSRASFASDVSLDMALLDVPLHEEKERTQSALRADSPSLCDLDSVQQPATYSSAEDGADEDDSDEENAPLEVDEGEESAVEEEAITASSVDGDDEGSFAALNTTAEEEACDDVDGQKSAAVEHIDVKLKVLRKRKEIASVELQLLEKKARLYELKNAN
ncbi:hypothetical protein AAVH_10713 [Aphelenchoides avenae]|nr:hypothetical protein AAVH_10713 [Aphelenchus avenae]